MFSDVKHNFTNIHEKIFRILRNVLSSQSIFRILHVKNKQQTYYLSLELQIIPLK